MLGKLLKHEFIATGRMFLPAYAALLVIALLSNILGFASNAWLPLDVASTVLLIVYVLLFGAVFTMGDFIEVSRFGKRVTGDEGYLTHTLPVKLSAVINSQIIVYVVWAFASVVVGLLSMFLLIVNSESALFLIQEIARKILEYNQMFTQYGLSFAVICAELFALISMVVVMVSIFNLCAMAIGHLAPKRKMLASFGAAVALFIAIQFCVGQVAALIELMGGLHGLQRGVEGLRVSPELLITMPLVNRVALYTGITIAVFCVALYAGTLWILNNKLNLE